MIESSYLTKLEAILRTNNWFMNLLHVVREVNPPDWYVGGGVIRTLVWDALHGYSEPTPLRDVDVAFFDPEDLSVAREAAIEKQLYGLSPLVPWEARNQAAVHTWYASKFGYEVAPLRSCAEGVATWPETATAVAVRLDEGALSVLAPCGLDDLFTLTLRRNPRRATQALFLKRLKEKRILETWPGVKVVEG